MQSHVRTHIRLLELTHTQANTCVIARLIESKMSLSLLRLETKPLKKNENGFEEYSRKYDDGDNDNDNSTLSFYATVDCNERKPKSIQTANRFQFID